MGNNTEKKSPWECVTDRWNAGAEGLLRYSCLSCGAALWVQKEDVTGICPFCDSRMEENVSAEETYRPDAVIPFILSRERAAEKYRECAEGAKFLPDDFTPERLADAIHGVYVPVWLYDSRVQYNVRAQAEEDNVTSTEVRNSTIQNIYFTENHYSVQRSGHVDFENVPAGASRAVTEDTLSSLAPYYFSDAVPFGKECLSCYAMAHCDVLPDEVLDIVENRMLLTLRKNREQVFKEYQRVLLEDDSMQALGHKVRCVLVPVWLCNIRWNGNTYLFAVNGQTGKTAGTFPVDSRKVKKKKLIRFLIVAGAAAALSILVFRVK